VESKHRKRLGKRVAAIRAKKHLSQETLAEKIGISRGFLSDIERGTRHMSVETLACFCRATKTPSSDLLGI
jgi:transcriptional regulator with XRE-family HTH domain